MTCLCWISFDPSQHVVSIKSSSLKASVTTANRILVVYYDKRQKFCIDTCIRLGGMLIIKKQSKTTERCGEKASYIFVQKAFKILSLFHGSSATSW